MKTIVFLLWYGKGYFLSDERTQTEDCPFSTLPVPAYWRAPQEAASMPDGKHSGIRNSVMLPVIDTPNDDHSDAQTLQSERPQAQGARPGFWRSLAHGITTSLTPTPREPHAPVGRTCRPFEPPMDRLVQESSSLSLLALAII